MIRLTRHRTVVSATGAEIVRARAAFVRDCSLRLPRFLEGEDLAFIQRRIEIDGFHEYVHEGLRAARSISV